MKPSDHPLFFDTHCHLDSKIFHDDVDEVVSSARDAGVTDILLVGISVDSSHRSAELAHRYELHFTAGIHPHEADNYSQRDEIEIADLTSDPLCVAIGEIGLDFYRNYARRDNQFTLFRRMLGLAQELELPVVLHQRSSEEELLTILDDYSLSAGGVFHCFSGNRESADEVIKRGFHISMAGNVTHKKSRLLKVAADIPLDRLLIETDAPYITPHPHRGGRNEPAYVVHTAASIADARGMDVADFAATTRSNGLHLFRL